MAPVAGFVGGVNVLVLDSPRTPVERTVGLAGK